MSKTIIIAEIGVNHNGSLEIAKKMVKIANNCGVDYVKFQIFNPDKLVCENAMKADYQIKNDNSTQTQKEMLKSLMLTKSDFVILKKHCDEIGLKFMTTAFDLDSLEFIINDLKVDMLKVPSGEITNYPLLVACGKSKLPVVLSTGMANVQEIRDCIEVLKKNGTQDITILHCTTEYPAPLESVNLRCLQTLKEEFGYNVGYSDHTKGTIVSEYAVVMGAKVIEKHFTLDKNMIGPDHKASLNPSELKKMIKNIRKIEKIMGDGNKVAQEAEIKNIAIARKSIVANCDIKKGELFTDKNITTKRPGSGVSPMKWPLVIGKKAKRDFKKDELIEI